MGAFGDDDKTDPNEYVTYTYTPTGTTNFMTPDTTRYWIDRHGDLNTAMSPNEGGIGTYNAINNMTLDHNGNFVGWGNWLPSLFGRKLGGASAPGA
jgi:hypothetical protein